MRKLYVVQNIMILLEACKVDMPIGEGNYFTINPYYTRQEEAQNKLQREIQKILPDLLYVSWSAVADRHYEKVYISSYIPDEPLHDVKYWDYDELILVEDGLYDYLDDDDGYMGVYRNKVCYLHLPELASERAKYGIVRKIPNDVFVTSLFLQAYREDLLHLHTIDSSLPILFTTPLQEDFNCTDDEIREMVTQLRDNFGYSKMVLKRHPRDYYEYQVDGIEFIECPKNIPGQFMDYLFNGDDLYLFPSTVSFMSDNATTVYLDALPNNKQYQDAYFKTAQFVANNNTTNVKLVSLNNTPIKTLEQEIVQKPKKVRFRSNVVRWNA